MTVRNRRWPAAASTAVRDLLTGAPRHAHVLARLRHALLLAVPDLDRTRVLAVVTSDAALVANAVLIADPASGRPLDGVGAGPVEVGDGRILLGDAIVTVARWWDARVPRIRPDVHAVVDLAGRAASRNGLDEVGMGMIDRVVKVAGAPAGASAWSSALRPLIGRGPGLTPAGDDVIAGVLVGLHAVGRGALARRLGAQIDASLIGRTTAFSAELIRLAAAGYAAGEVLTVIRALHERSAGAGTARAVDGLLSVGHTSGADLATGLALALSRQSRSDRGAEDVDAASVTGWYERAFPRMTERPRV